MELQNIILTREIWVGIINRALNLLIGKHSINILCVFDYYLMPGLL